MSHEHSEQAEAVETTAAWDVFQYWTGSRDVDRFRACYLGHYASRDAFGQELARSLGADARLQRLPDWLRAYIRFDGAAVVADFERVGHFYIYDAPHDGGTFVFDAYTTGKTA
jgi:antirestriction protein